MSQTLCKLHGRDIAVCSVVCLTQVPQASWSVVGCQERLWGPGIFTTEIQQLPVIWVVGGGGVLPGRRMEFGFCEGFIFKCLTPEQKYW